MKGHLTNQSMFPPYYGTDAIKPPSFPISHASGSSSFIFRCFNKKINLYFISSNKFWTWWKIWQKERNLKMRYILWYHENVASVDWSDLFLPYSQKYGVTIFTIFTEIKAKHYVQPLWTPESLHSRASLQMSKPQEKPNEWLHLRCYESIEPQAQIQSYSR